MNKPALRKEMLKKRISVSEELLQSNSSMISDIIISTNEYKEADTILIYVAAKGEIPTKNIIADAFKKEKTVATPRIDNETMNFYKINSLSELEKGGFDIYEPKDYCPKCNTGNKTLLIAPGVAFDEDKNRLGYGKGYFDKYLNSHSHNNLAVIGICHDFQILNSIPHNKYDAKMDKIISEKRIIK